MQFVNEKELSFTDGVKYVIRGPNIDWGILELEPGVTFSPHYHDEVEETFYILSGSGIFKINGEDVKVQEGTAMRLEPKESHGIVNTGDVKLRMIFIKHLFKPKDKVMCE
jgi:mannose-6-phosphate isomerase-like protein (cupin superfamily)